MDKTTETVQIQSLYDANNLLCKLVDKLTIQRDIAREERNFYSNIVKNFEVQ